LFKQQYLNNQLLANMTLRSLRQRFYETSYKIFVVLARLFDFRMYNIHLLWFHDKEFMHVWKNFPESNNSIHERRFNLYSIAKSIRSIPGDMAECGVWKGASSYLMLTANEGVDKQMHIFDSFEGLSQPDPEDTPSKDRTFRWKENDLSATEDHVRRNLHAFSNVYYYKGWIPDRFSDVDKRKFSLVHLDVDLYQPTLDSLKFFYSRMSRGGVIVCDDYGFETCPGAHSSMNEFMNDKPEGIIHLTTGQGIIIKQ
jgi:O-methyltransferase